MELSWVPEVPQNIASLTPYPPGKPIAETEREYGITGVVKLASNENPLGASPKALEAIRGALKELQLYPDGSHYSLKAKLAKHLGCSTDELSIGNGSNEFIDLIPRVFVAKGRNLVTHQTAFVIYKLCAQLQGCECREAQVDENLRPSVDGLLSLVDANTRLVMIANPNNPTGTHLTKSEIERLAGELEKKHVLLVLDYAYWEFVTDPSIPDPIEVFRKFPNVIVLRTFSKIYGLAGLRVGYAVGRKSVISMLEKARQPFNVSSLALIAAEAALDDKDFLNRSRELNTKSKAELTAGLAAFPVRVYPSQGNFLLVDMKRESKALHHEFLKRGVIVRPVSNYGLPTCMRVSAGLPEENKKFLAAMKDIFGAG